jgi:hypothetical protein
MGRIQFGHGNTQHPGHLLQVVTGGYLATKLNVLYFGPTGFKRGIKRRGPKSALVHAASASQDLNNFRLHQFHEDSSMTIYDKQGSAGLERRGNGTIFRRIGELLLKCIQMDIRSREILIFFYPL